VVCWESLQTFRVFTAQRRVAVERYSVGVSGVRSRTARWRNGLLSIVMYLSISDKASTKERREGVLEAACVLDRNEDDNQIDCELKARLMRGGNRSG
jgi:hypothetical protein